MRCLQNGRIYGKMVEFMTAHNRRNRFCHQQHTVSANVCLYLSLLLSILYIASSSLFAAQRESRRLCACKETLYYSQSINVALDE
jgi:hypothetical protein